MYNVHLDLTLVIVESTSKRFQSIHVSAYETAYWPHDGRIMALNIGNEDMIIILI